MRPRDRCFGADSHGVGALNIWGTVQAGSCQSGPGSGSRCAVPRDWPGSQCDRCLRSARMRHGSGGKDGRDSQAVEIRASHFTLRFGAEEPCDLTLVLTGPSG